VGVAGRDPARAEPETLSPERGAGRAGLGEAEAMVIDRSPIIDATAMLECVLSAYVVLVRIAAHRRNAERAYALLEQLENLGHMRKWGRVVAVALAIRLRFYLK
jgi:LuxR family maltose regulon positive regulatory protein